MKKTLSKRTSDEINLLPQNITMLTTISKTIALDKVKDIVELLRGDKPHHLHAEYKDDTLTELGKLHVIFEPSTQKEEVTEVPRVALTKHNLIHKPQLLWLLINKPNEMSADEHEKPTNVALQQHKHP